MKQSPLDNPARNAATLRNLVHGFRFIGVNPWLEEATLQDVIDAWHKAQGQKRRAAQLGLTLQPREGPS